MASIYMELNNVNSHVLTWGEPVSGNKHKDTIICISGNPGIVDFYTEFGNELFKNTEIPVCVVGHAGHEDIDDSVKLKGHENLFDLNGQLNHKLDFIANHIPKDTKLHFIGHSIGSWMILELLNKNKSLIDRVSTVNLLFPTIQKMAKSKNGLFLNNIVRRIHFFIMLLVNLLDILPRLFFKSLFTIYMKFRSIPVCFTDAVMKFCCSNVIEKVLFLSYDEMDRVQALNTDIINVIKDKMFVVYCDSDGWAPVSYMDDLRMFEPDLKLKKADAEHAFVLKSSIEIADMVSDFIKSKM